MIFKSLYELFLSWFAPKELPKPTFTTIKILVGDKVVGSIQTLSIIELNNDTSKLSTPNKVTAHRVRFDKLRIGEAFSRGFVNENAQKLPFQIEIEDDHVITKVQNSWIDGAVNYYMASNWIIIDCIDFVAEKIYSKKK
jgi:hypothetical protein